MLFSLELAPDEDGDIEARSETQQLDEGVIQTFHLAPAFSHDIQTMGDNGICTIPCGVGMTLEPPEPGPGCFCYVAEIKPGGAVDQSGRVAVGDQLVRIDGFDCVGQARHEIKRHVMGPQGTEIVLEFKRAGQDTFEVTLLRTVAPTAAAGKDDNEHIRDGTEKRVDGKRVDGKKNTFPYSSAYRSLMNSIS